MHTYRADDAETIVVAMGSVLGTIKDTIDEMRDEGHRIGALAITSYRPFPGRQVRDVLKGAKRVVVLEKSMAVGIGGILASDIRLALSELPVVDYAVIAGLGGRPITCKSLRTLFDSAMRDALEPLTFLDLDWTIVNRHLERERTVRRSGPAAENILRELGRGASQFS